MQEYEIRALISDLESDRIERTISFKEDKLGSAVCALSNDFPNNKQSGYILLGIKDNGKVAGISIGVAEETLHRNYESNSPIYIYEFSSSIEIVNPGGLYGDVTPQNFPHASDYRNVVIAESMKRLGYVNRFNYGVQNATKELEANGNGSPVFDLNLVTKFKVTIHISEKWKS